MIYINIVIMIILPEITLLKELLTN